MTTRPVTVTLVEVPAVSLEMGGAKILDDFTLGHPKYPQLVLAANLRRLTDPGVTVQIVDLKGGGPTESVPYARIDYCGERVDCHRIGVPFEREHDRLVGVDVVGISANFTFERSMVVQTIDYVRRHGKAPLIVVGGHDATADPVYYLQRGADLCVLGEGETALQEIARAVSRGESPAIPGTASWHGGRLRRDARRPPHRFEDIAFPDADLLTTTHFHESPDGPLPSGVGARLMAFEASRGCPEACTFCDVSFIVGRYRAVSLERLLQQIEAFKAAGIRTIQVIDDNLLYRTLPAHDGERGRQTLIDLFTRLYDEGFAWEFFNGVQLGLFERGGVIDEGLIDALYRNGRDGNRVVGCFRSYVPLDKVTTDEMSRLRKLKPLDVAKTVVGAIAARGVPALALGFVIGSVRETKDTLSETMTRAADFHEIVRRSSGGRTLPVVLPLCSIPLPGTPDCRSFSPHIMFPAERYPELYNIYVSVLANEAFAPIDLTHARRRMQDDLAAGFDAERTPLRMLPG